MIEGVPPRQVWFRNNVIIKGLILFNRSCIEIPPSDGFTNHNNSLNTCIGYCFDYDLINRRLSRYNVIFEDTGLKFERI